MDFDFAGSVRDLGAGLLVKPLLHNYLFDAKFPAFSLHFEKQDMERKPDGWFHPSTHPNWSASALFRYIAYPERFPVERKQYMGTLSVTIGKVMHEFIQMCLTDAGVMPRDMQVCTMCPPQYECKEAGFAIEETRDRGHVDGLLDLSSLGPRVPQTKVFPIFEFKTSHDNFGKLSRIEDDDLDTFRQKWPDYWAQQQRYQHMSGRRWSVVLFMETMYPWTMREFHVPYDAAWNQQVDLKYRSVLHAVETGQEPFCCRQKGCPSARLCGA